ncbi:hypothetical protein STRATTON_129 [Erwinia phage vB_EamM_Stratton]|uniref:Uncharacterized protein n=2 Tax=Erskinevirus EaH2 TaxID=2169883 RepID=A0A1B2IH43_9CAUD|nr:hypothetical protein G173_gp034 [Erwinia phage phiEaH2]AFQ96579.1 hypothetical protein [Erwinia phage phiEaH2]ANZ50554.1 hypothetical protein STRATTON_129 [Erwinia phage vB_EamM_Stratton]
MKSIAIPMGTVQFPEFSGIRIYLAEALAGVAHKLVEGPYSAIVRKMLDDAQIPADQKVFLTIDEKELAAGQPHRRGGAHIDGVYDMFADETRMGWGGGGGWLNGVPGRMLDDAGHKRSYQNENGGMLIVSSFPACQVWTGELDGVAGQGGSCEHLRDKFDTLETSVMDANRVYKASSMCIHESLPVTQDVKRQLLRITLSEQYQFH